MKSQGDFFQRHFLSAAVSCLPYYKNTFFFLYHIFETKHGLLTPRQLSLPSKSNFKPQLVFPAGFFRDWHYLAHLDVHCAERVF